MLGLAAVLILHCRPTGSNPFHPSRRPLAAILPLFLRRVQLPIPLGLNLLLMPGEHVLRRHVTDRAVQPEKPSSPNSIRFCFSSTWRGGTLLRLESGGSVLEQLLLPAVEHRWPQASSSHRSETGCSVHKMPPQDGYFFFWREMLPFLPHTFAPLS